MTTVSWDADGNALPAKSLILINFVVCCAATSTGGMASQAGAPPPETAVEALDARKHHS